MPNVYEVITGRIIKQLESGTAPWHKPWKGRGKSGLPRNLVSGREYRGINVWTLRSSGYADPRWLTFRQARQLDGHVRQGEAGSPIVYWKFGAFVATSSTIGFACCLAAWRMLKPIKQEMRDACAFRSNADDEPLYSPGENG